MVEAMRLISSRRLEALEVSRRRLRWGLAAMAGLALALAVGAAGPPAGVKLSGAVRLAEASTADVAAKSDDPRNLRTIAS